MSESSSSAHYVFRGYPASISSAPPPPPASLPAPGAPATSPTSSEYDGMDDDEVYSDDALAVMGALEQIAVWQAEVEGLRSHLDSLEEVTTALSASLERERAYVVKHEELQAHINALESQLSDALQSQGNVLLFCKSPHFSPPTLVFDIPASDPEPCSPASTPGRNGLSLSPLKTAYDLPLPATTTFLGAHDLGTHAGAIHLMVRHVSAAKWYEELARLAIDESFRSDLLDCLTQDFE
ncbi:hypothetical protein DFH09DRAFT_1331937 [Mycena vulgaris]|nr:hypothetical protein DFH09DRAFT_1331937 [Mycena vulgaris]